MTALLTLNTSVDLQIVRGNTQTVTCTVRDPDQNLLNITGYTPRMTVKLRQPDNDAAAMFQLTGTISDQVTHKGECTFALTPTQTTLQPGKYYYDVSISRASPLDVKTVIPSSIFEVVWDITQTAP